MKTDRLIINLILEVSAQTDTPFVAGIYLAGTYAATLSTVASSINALACSTLEDYVKVYHYDLKTRYRRL